ncbi:MAG: SufD family Fe-S cluster assembly protein [Rickettsiales bacterium]|jgi:hypothetical protein|nr:SufD family Fe-S cluster assembly protein [Rickettsiales bacterium]
MNYLWERFAIPVFPARTRVWLDGAERPDLSDTRGEGPVHYIVQGGSHLPPKIDVKSGETAYLTAILDGAAGKIEINAAKGAKFKAGIFIENKGAAEIIIMANHLGDNSEISVDVRIEAAAGSSTAASAAANIPRGLKNIENSIDFGVLADRGVKSVRLSPGQFIKSAGVKASHGAAIQKENPAQIIYLEQQGLSENESAAALREAFRAAAFDHLPKTAA